MAHLSLLQRKQIEAGIAHGKSNAQIALEAGVHRATIGREIKRNALSRELYEAQQAQKFAHTTQRMAVSFRNFEGIGAYALSICKKKKTNETVDADFFQLDYYYRSKTFRFSSWSFAVNSERNRYTDHEKFSEGLRFTIKDSPLFGSVYLTLFSSHYLKFPSFKYLTTHSSFLATSYSSFNPSAEVENSACTSPTLPAFSLDTIDVQLSDKEAFNTLFNETNVLPVKERQQRAFLQESKIIRTLPGSFSMHVGTGCKFFSRDHTFSAERIFSGESFNHFLPSF